MSIEAKENDPVDHGRIGASEVEKVFSRQWLDAALAGDLTTAWSASDRIRKAKIEFYGKERWCRSLWDGSPIDGRNVLLRCWRGLGDAIHFIRYAPLVRAKAHSLTVEAPRVLLPVLETVHGIDEVRELDKTDFEEGKYVQVESTELPYLFRSTLDSLPRTIPYIHLPASGPGSGTERIKIGLCWCGGSYDPRRAIPLADLQPLAEMPDVSLYQLQRGEALEETKGSSFKFLNLSACSMDLYSTSKLINSLDVIVSVDTMVAHLAGALGKKAYLLLHTEADWRWMRNRQDSPWYPTMSLLRQSQAGDWKPVVGRLVNLLTRRARSSRQSTSGSLC